MCTSNAHVPMEVRQHDVRASIDVPALKGDVPLPLGLDPVNPSRRLVDLVFSAAHVSEVAKSVVRSVSVNVVNLIGLFSVEKKPSNAVRLIGSVPVVDLQVALRGQRFANIIFSAGSAFYSAYTSSIGVIGKAFADRIRDNLISHIVLPHGLVRGPVVGATVPRFYHYEAYIKNIMEQDDDIDPVFQ